MEAKNLQLPGAGRKKPFLAKNAPVPPLLAENEAMFNKATAQAIWLQIKGAGRFTFNDGAWGAKWA
jgi:hypothetical protein